MSGLRKLKDIVKRGKSPAAEGDNVSGPADTQVTPATSTPLDDAANVADNDTVTLVEDNTSIVVDGKNPRLVQSDRKLIAASRELIQALHQYSQSQSGSQDAGPALLPVVDADDTDAIATVRDPAKLSSYVDGILAKQKEKKATISSRFGGVVGKIYPLLSLTLGVSSAVAEGASFVPVKGTVNALSLLLAIAGQEHSKSQDILKQLDRLSFQALRVEAIQQPGAELNDVVVEKATDLMTAILGFFKGALLYLKHDYFHHVWEGMLLGPQVYANAKTDLDAAINEFDQALFLQVTLKLLAAQPTAPVLPKDEDFITAELMTWLQASHWEVEAECSRHYRSRIEGTLDWVFDIQEFKDWRLDRDSQQVSGALWLTGLPGVGKSTIAAYVVQALKAQNPDAAVLYFFCKAGDNTLNTPSQIVRTLASQLVGYLPAARDHLQKRKEKDLKVSGADAMFLYEELLRDALKESTKDIIIVLDGLDEIDTEIEGAASALETLLSSLSSLNVKLLVSSRVTADISTGLSKATRRELTFDDSRSDIQLYVSHCVRNSRILEKGFSSLNIDAPTFLSEKSAGNFLWVRLVLDNLKRKKTGKEFKGVLDTLPKDLEGIYLQILDRLEARGALDLTLTVLKCVLHGSRPLGVAEVETMASLMLEDELFDVEAIVDADCGSFLRQTAHTPPAFYIVHETFRSFITSKSSGKHCIDTGTAHFDLLLACLTCLSSPDEESYDCVREYAAAYWLDHLSVVYRELESFDADQVARILNSLHGLCDSTPAVTKWLRSFSFQTDQPYNLGNLIGAAYNIIQSTVFEGVTRLHDIAPDFEYVDHDAVEWANRIAGSPHGLADKMKLDFYHTWLNTNWKELDLSKWVARAALSMTDILRRKHHSEDTVKARGWRHGNYVNDTPSFTEELLTEVILASDYDEYSGLHLANHAIGLLVAGAEPSAATELQTALDYDDCSTSWHIHEALAHCHESAGDTDLAISSLESALALDPKPHPSCLFKHCTLLAERHTRAGDTEAAVAAYRTGLSRAPPSQQEQYWTAMATLWEKQGNGTAMIALYNEAARSEHTAPSNRRIFWEKLAETYQRGGARQEQWHALRTALAKDPENAHRYGEAIRRLAGELAAVAVFAPVEVMLAQGAIEEPGMRDEYYRELGKAHMARRMWRKAVEMFEKAAETSPVARRSWGSEDLGHAYLGAGMFDMAEKAYKGAVDVEGRSAALRARTVGMVCVLRGEYGRAVTLFRAGIKEAEGWGSGGTDISEGGGWGVAFGRVDDSREQRLFQMHLQLGLCHEALATTAEKKQNRAGLKEEEDKVKDAAINKHKASAQENFAKAIDALKPIALEMDSDRDRSLLYRHEGRSLFHVGLVEERLQRFNDAVETLKRAVELFEFTRLEEDDAVQQSELDEAKEALRRCEAGAGDPLDILQAPDLKENEAGMTLQRRLALPYIMDWYCSKEWTPPGKRGAKEWNEVSFTNKFVVRNGERRYVIPWGFGHT